MSRDLFDLSGRCALVTGASRGIGRAIAIAYAEAGADVAVLARDGDRLADVAIAVEKAGGRAVVLVADVTDRAGVDLAVSSAIERLGHIDIVVNNAGGNRFSMPFVGIRFDGWQKTLAAQPRLDRARLPGRRPAPARARAAARSSTSRRWRGWPRCR